MESLTTEDEEDWLRLPLSSTKPAVEPPEVHAKKRQKKVVTLDDLVQDDLKKKPKAKSNKLVQKLKAKAHLYSYSDEEGEENLRAPKLLEELEKQVTNGIGEEVEPEWGQEVFRAQLEPPSTVCRVCPLPSCKQLSFIVWYVYELLLFQSPILERPGLSFHSCLTTWYLRLLSSSKYVELYC